MDLSLSLFLFSYGDNKDQEEDEDYFDSSYKKKILKKDEEDLILFSFILKGLRGLRNWALGFPPHEGNNSTQPNKQSFQWRNRK